MCERENTARVGEGEGEGRGEGRFLGRVEVDGGKVGFGECWRRGEWWRVLERR